MESVAIKFVKTYNGELSISRCVYYIDELVTMHKNRAKKFVDNGFAIYA